MARTIILNLLILVFSIYFGFHLIWGQKGYFQYVELHEDFYHKLNDFQKARLEKTKWEQKASLLNRKSLDIDTLDEYSRKVLGLAKPSELILPSAEKNKH